MEIRRRSPSPKIRVSYLEYGVPHEEEEPRNILEKIVWEKDREVELARQKVPLDQLKKQIWLAATHEVFHCCTQAGSGEASGDCRGQKGQPK